MKLNYSKYIDPYINKILNNKIPHCPEQEQMINNIVIPVLEREDIIIDNKKIEDGLSLQKYFDYKLLDWEIFLFALIAGVFFKDGENFYNEIDIIVGRGAGKNGFISFLAFYFLSPYHGIKKYDVEIIANTEEQAKTSFNDIYEVVTDNHNPENNPALEKFYYATKEQIKGLSTNSILRFNTSSLKGKDSKRTGCVIVDEKHEYTIKDCKNLNTLKSGLGKVSHSRFITITTDGHLRGGALDRDKEKFKDVLASYNPRNRKLIFWCRAVDPDDWKNPDSWLMANPSLNDFPTLKRQIEDEVADMVYTPEYFSEFMAKRLNCPVGERQTEVAKWEDLLACEKPIDFSVLKGKKCIGGLDFAETSDFVVCGLLFKVDYKYVFYHHTFVCRKCSDLIGIKAPLDEWEQMGMLEYVDDVTVPGELIAQWFEDCIHDGFDIIKIVADKFRFKEVNSAFKKIGFDYYENDNIKIARPSDLMIASPIINSLFLRHRLIWGESKIKGVNNIMAWYTNNVRKVMKNGNAHFEKQEEHYRKTDGFMAFANAVTCIELLDEEKIKLDDNMKRLMETLVF